MEQGEEGTHVTPVFLACVTIWMVLFIHPGNAARDLGIFVCGGVCGYCKFSFRYSFGIIML